MQSYKLFFGSNHPYVKDVPSLEERTKIAREGFNSFIGNELALEKLKVIVFSGLGREDHCVSDLGLAVFGPASSGKTSLVKKFSGLLDIPFIEFSPKAIKTLDDVYVEIDRKLNLAGVPLVGVVRRNYYVLPPCVIFFDEVHALSNNIVQGLLKATEHNDRQLVTSSGVTLDCSKVCWVLATTDEGKMFDAFRTRFSVIRLKYLTRKQIGQIVKLNFPEWSGEVCDKIAFYNSLVPRKSLAFGRYLKMVLSMRPGEDVSSVVDLVAKMEGIDEFGMHESQLNVLKSLKDGPLSKNRLVAQLGVKIEEIENFVMPELLASVEDRESLVGITSRGYGLTAAGVLELGKRGIDCKPIEVE